MQWKALDDFQAISGKLSQKLYIFSPFLETGVIPTFYFYPKWTYREKKVVYARAPSALVWCLWLTWSRSESFSAHNFFAFFGLLVGSTAKFLFFWGQSALQIGLLWSIILVCLFLGRATGHDKRLQRFRVILCENPVKPNSNQRFTSGIKKVSKVGFFTRPLKPFLV